MSGFTLVLVTTVLVLFKSYGSDAAIVKHTFNVADLTVDCLCESRVITAVNGQFPGPTIHAQEGDTLVVHVLNNSPYNISIHWHGIFQMLTAWADGPNMITQCPIVPGKSYTYKFNIIGQEGTLWWHAHVSTLRATVYGALIIFPKNGHSYPFPKPYDEVPIVLGEWWNANVVDVENEALLSGGTANISDAFTINGRPGDLYKCSKHETYKLEVLANKTYLLRIINAALDNQLFFKIASHTFTIVAVDACYTTPYHTDVIAIAPGQTVDALLSTTAPPCSYYMAAHPYISGINSTFPNTTTTAIVHYKSSSNSLPPIMPVMPPFNDTPTAHKFYSSLLGLIYPTMPIVPTKVDHHMFITIGLGLAQCGVEQVNCKGISLAASMNNVSFQFPTKMSLLEAHFEGVEGVYTRDFPDVPVFRFDYTGVMPNQFMMTEKGTKVKRVKFNQTVEVVLQNTAILSVDNHPIHLHGFNFFVLAQGFGNYDGRVDGEKFNLRNPQVRNTIAVPTGGWAVIRFQANNPGIWFMHCHLDVHLPLGLGMIFEVENGGTAVTTLPPPPSDFPTC